jgi:hypothetical protein
LKKKKQKKKKKKLWYNVTAANIICEMLHTVQVSFIVFAVTCRPVRGFTQPPAQWEPGAVFLGLKRPEYEAGQDLLLSDEVTNARNSTCVTHLSS